MWNSYTSTVSPLYCFPIELVILLCGDYGHFSLSFIKLCFFVVIEEYPTLFKRKTLLFYCTEIRECISNLKNATCIVSQISGHAKQNFFY